MQVLSINTANAQVMDAQASAAKTGLERLANTGDRQKLRQAAEDFEAVFLSQMLAPMFATVETDSLTGGGTGEDIFRSMMVEQVGKEVAKKGGIGIADQVYRELLKYQEA